MPIIKSAQKKVRKDKKRIVQNKIHVAAYRETLKQLKKGGKNVAQLVKKFYSQVDKAVKKNVIHKNKGRRLKSKVCKFVSKK